MSKTERIAKALEKLIRDIGGCTSTKDVIAWHKKNKTVNQIPLYETHILNLEEIRTEDAER
jgi:hypothetical protein